MKNLFTTLLLTLIIAFSVKSQSVISLVTKDLNGNTTSIEQVTNANLIVLDFWATWCKPCVKSIPKLVELSNQYDAEKLAFIGINEDSPRNINKVKPFVKSLNVTYPILLDPDQELMGEMFVSSFPTLLVINREGEILYSHEGYISGDEKIIEEELNKLLAENE